MDAQFERKKRIKNETYRVFRGGVPVISDALRNHYRRGRLSKDKPTWEQPAALGAWLAGQDDARDGVSDQQQ